MGLKNYYAIWIGLFVIIFLIALLLIQTKKNNNYKGGKKVINNSFIDDDPYYKKKLTQYKIFMTALTIACLSGIVVCFIMLARPYETNTDKEKIYNRDIILCIDISTSVDYLNMNLVEELTDTVNRLNGERFGIVIFNTSPVTIVPLTDDYEYVITQLNKIKEALNIRIETTNGSLDYDSYDSLDEITKLDQYISAGTLVGNEERGSSIIGDGLAAGAYEFYDEKNERTKVMIFTSDNDLYGTPIYTLDEAADICVENNITVFGVGTKEMVQENMDEMKAAVEKTGGKFFLEESSGSFDEIANDIEKMSKSLLREDTHTKTMDIVKLPFIILLLFVSTMIVTTKILKK